MKALGMNRPVLALMVAGAFAAGCGDKGSGSGAASAEKIGVQACDDYIAKMEACFAKHSSVKSASEASFKTTRDSWKEQAARGAKEKDALKTVCEAALASIDPTCNK